MFFNRIFFYFILTQTTLLLNLTRRIYSIQSEYIYLNKADIRLEKYTFIEAFKSSTNDEIISNNETEKYSQLIWYSLGYPTIITNNQNILNFNSNNFYIYIQTLSNDQRDLLKYEIKNKYNINIHRSQIKHLIPTSFKCIYKFESIKTNNIINLIGNVIDFNHLPFELVFNYDLKQIERKLFESDLETNIKNLSLNCELKIEPIFKRSFNINKIECLNIDSLSKLDLVLYLDKKFDQYSQSINKTINLLKEEVNNLKKNKNKKHTSFESNSNEKYLNKKINFKNIKLINTLTFHRDSITALVELNNGYLASGSVDNTIQIWDLNNGKKIKTIDNKSSVYKLIAFKYKHLISGSENGRISLYSISGQLKKQIQAHLNGINSLVILNNGHLASASWNENFIKIWSKNNWNEKLNINTKSKVFCFIEYMNVYLISGSYEYIKLWDINTGDLIKQIFITSSTYIYNLAILSNMNLLSSTSLNEVQIWNLKTNEMIKKINSNEYSIKNQKFYPLTLLLNDDIVTGYGNNIKFWHLNSDENELFQLDAHLDIVSSLDVLKNGCLISGSNDNLIKIWNISYF